MVLAREVGVEKILATASWHKEAVLRTARIDRCTDQEKRAADTRMKSHPVAVFCREAVDQATGGGRGDCSQGNAREQKKGEFAQDKRARAAIPNRVNWRGFRQGLHSWSGMTRVASWAH